MKLITNILAKNDCYKASKTIKVKGLMIHSIGCPQPSAPAIFNNWNKPGVTKCVHAFIEPDGDVYQTLPWDMRGWHGGGVSNNSYIGCEMTEPSTIKYVGGANWTDLNPAKTKAHVLDTYQTAVELYAKLCTDFKLDPLADGVIISHSEGFKRGIASNHADVEHLWNKFGLTMVQFRKDIKLAMIQINGQEVNDLTIKEFQKMTGLKVDGIAGAITEAKAKEMQIVINNILFEPRTVLRTIGIYNNGDIEVKEMIR